MDQAADAQAATARSNMNILLVVIPIGSQETDFGHGLQRASGLYFDIRHVMFCQCVVSVSVYPNHLVCVGTNLLY